MAISKLVDYEVTSHHELNGPDGNPVGIGFEVRSNNNPEAQRILKSIAACRMAVDASADKSQAAYEAMFVKIEELNVQFAASCLVSIDWRDEEWNEGEGPLPDTKAGKVTFCKADWIFPQIIEKAKSLGGFTKA
jgi:hypothetical protein